MSPTQKLTWIIDGIAMSLSLWNLFRLRKQQQRLKEWDKREKPTYSVYECLDIEDPEEFERCLDGGSLE